MSFAGGRGSDTMTYRSRPVLLFVSTNGSSSVKKGRHRRFEEARALKRLNEEIVEPCAECGAQPGADHAAWCMAMEDMEMEDVEEDEYSDSEPHRA